MNDAELKQKKWFALKASVKTPSPPPASFKKAESHMKKGQKAIKADRLNDAIIAYSKAAELYDNAIIDLKGELHSICLKTSAHIKVLLNHIESDQKKLNDRVVKSKRAVDKYEREGKQEKRNKAIKEYAVLKELATLCETQIFKGQTIVKIKSNLETANNVFKNEKYSEALEVLREAEKKLKSSSFKVSDAEATIRSKNSTTETLQAWKALNAEDSKKNNKIKKAFKVYNKANRLFFQNEWQASKETYIEAKSLFEAAIMDEKYRRTEIAVKEKAKRILSLKKEAARIKSQQREKKETVIKSQKKKEIIRIKSILKRMKFVYLKPGVFMMGSPPAEPGRDNDEKQHLVTLTRGFFLQTTEVTQRQWKAVMGDNPSIYNDCGADCPVENVSWDEVQQFIEKINSIDSKRKFRLPTEAEWEYACRAGTDTPFNTEECLSTKQANYNGYHPYKGCSKGKNRKSPIAVASFPPNEWGLHDMHGNVNEWCQDWYGNYPSGSITDPQGPQSGSFRVLRGGSWSHHAAYCRSALRSNGKPDGKFDILGFRLAYTESQ